MGQGGGLFLFNTRTLICVVTNLDDVKVSIGIIAKVIELTSKCLTFWQEDCVLKRRIASHSTYGKCLIVNNITLIILTFSEVSTAKMSKRGRGGAAGAKFRISLACPVGAVMNCADNTGAKNL